MGIFGWSYPAGAENDPFAPYNQVDDWGLDIEELKKELEEFDTGRWDWDRIDCCITGKDADLEPYGQQGVEIVGADENFVHVLVHGGKTFPGIDVCLNVPDDMSTEQYDKCLDAYLEQAQEVVCGTCFSGEWDGDAWFFSFEDSIHVEWVVNNGAVDYKKTARAVIDAAEAALKNWESEMSYADDMLSVLSGWRTQKGVPCKPGRPSKDCAWRNTVSGNDPYCKNDKKGRKSWEEKI